MVGTTQIFRFLIYGFYWLFLPGALVRKKYRNFRWLLELDKRSLVLISNLEEIAQGIQPSNINQVKHIVKNLSQTIRQEIQALNKLSFRRDTRLYKIHNYLDSK